MVKDGNQNLKVITLLSIQMLSFNVEPETYVPIFLQKKNFQDNQEVIKYSAITLVKKENTSNEKQEKLSQFFK